MNRTSVELPRDEELIVQHLQGERDAFPILFKRYKNRVFLLVRGFFPNREKAEEVFQEVFLKVLERLDSFDSAGSFKSWFLTLCRNHCIDRIRQQSRRPEVPESEFRNREEDYPTPIERSADPELGADRKAYDRELAGLLDRALAKLPEEQRETFLLKERGALTFEEIAEISGVSINTVKSRMRYALESLRRALRGKDYVKEALR